MRLALRTETHPAAEELEDYWPFKNHQDRRYISHNIRVFYFHQRVNSILGNIAMWGKLNLWRGSPEHLLHNGIRLRYYIHRRTFDSLLRLPEEKEIYAGCNERY